jgi:hypothetical protein
MVRWMKVSEASVRTQTRNAKLMAYNLLFSYTEHYRIAMFTSLMHISGICYKGQDSSPKSSQLYSSTKTLSVTLLAPS